MARAPTSTTGASADEVKCPCCRGGLRLFSARGGKSKRCALCCAWGRVPTELAVHFALIYPDWNGPPSTRTAAFEHLHRENIRDLSKSYGITVWSRRR